MRPFWRHCIAIDVPSRRPPSFSCPCAKSGLVGGILSIRLRMLLDGFSRRGPILP
jgi:hypothetical protein